MLIFFLLIDCYPHRNLNFLRKNFPLFFFNDVMLVFGTWWVSSKYLKGLILLASVFQVLHKLNHLANFSTGLYPTSSWVRPEYTLLMFFTTPMNPKLVFVSYVYIQRVCGKWVSTDSQFLSLSLFLFLAGSLHALSLTASQFPTTVHFLGVWQYGWPLEAPVFGV